MTKQWSHEHDSAPHNRADDLSIGFLMQ